MAIKPVEILIKARDEASGIFGSLQGKVAAVGAAIAGYFGISAFIGAVKGAAELEAKLSEVKSVSGATAQEMLLLRKAAEDAGGSTKYSALEGAEALGNLTRAGLSAKDAIAALPAVLNLAQAGGIGLGEASEFVTKAVQGMGLQFSDAGRVADVLALGANASNASVTGLAQALSYAAPVANSLGLSLETTVAIIGKFSDAGIDASRAGTALNAVLSQFADPASKFRQELGSAGIITSNFEQALHELAAAGPSGEKAILAVGTEAGPALRALLNQGIGALDDLKLKLSDAAGSAAATAAVMEDNLNGAFNNLSSAWDTVKNALATPVLPVLREAVTKLSDSLSASVKDGTIGKFGDALATAFQSGLKWAREFLGTVDFVALTVKMQDWADRAGETFTRIGESATNAGNVVQTAYGVMSAGANVVLAYIYGLGAVFAETAAGIVKTAAVLSEALAKVAFGSARQKLLDDAATMREVLVGLTGVSEAFKDKAAEAMGSAAEGAELARKGFDGLSSASAAANSQAVTSTQVMSSLASTLAQTGDTAKAAGDQAKAAAVVQSQAVEQTRAAVATLKKEYEAALAAGNVQLAVEKLAALNKALQGTASTAKTAAEQIKGVEEAFTRLGVTSTADLIKQREGALRDFKIIRDSGLGTADDLRNAFAAYAEKAIAANGGVATETLKSEAAMRGLKITTDEAGNAIVESMTNAANSTKKAGKAASDAAGDYERMAASARQATLSGMNAGGQNIAPKDSSGRSASETAAMSKQGGPVDASYVFDLQRRAEKGELVAGDLAAAKNALNVAKSNARIGGAGSVSLEGRADDAKWVNRLTAIVSKLETMNAATTAPAPSSTVPGAGGNTGFGPRTVNINFGSGSSSINVASQSDADKLQALLEELARESKRARP